MVDLDQVGMSANNKVRSMDKPDAALAVVFAFAMSLVTGWQEHVIFGIDFFGSSIAPAGITLSIASATTILLMVYGYKRYDPDISLMLNQKIPAIYVGLMYGSYVLFILNDAVSTSITSSYVVGFIYTALMTGAFVTQYKYKDASLSQSQLRNLLN